MRTILWLCIVACAGAAPAIVPAAKPAPLRVTVRVGPGYWRALDTLTMIATWTNPVDDGRGPVDSLRLWFFGIGRDTFFVYRAPLPTRKEWKHIIPQTAYATGPGGLGTYQTRAEMLTFRRGKSTVVTTPDFPVTIADLPPPPVGGFSLMVVKTP